MLRPLRVRDGPLAYNQSDKLSVVLKKYINHEDDKTNTLV